LGISRKITTNLQKFSAGNFQTHNPTGVTAKSLMNKGGKFDNRPGAGDLSLPLIGLDMPAETVTFATTKTSSNHHRQQQHPPSNNTVISSNKYI